MQKEYPTVGTTECEDRMKALIAERTKQDQLFGPKIDSVKTNKKDTYNVVRTNSKTE